MAKHPGNKIVIDTDTILLLSQDKEKPLPKQLSEHVWTEHLEPRPSGVGAPGLSLAHTMTTAWGLRPGGHQGHYLHGTWPYEHESWGQSSVSHGSCSVFLYFFLFRIDFLPQSQVK